MAFRRGRQAAVAPVADAIFIATERRRSRVAFAEIVPAPGEMVLLMTCQIAFVMAVAIRATLVMVALMMRVRSALRCMPHDAAAGGAGGRRQPGKFFERTPRQRDAYPAIGPVLESMPEGEDFLMRPVDAGLIPYTALKDGSVDLADIARMNDWLDLKADNENRIAKWREANER